MHRSGRTGRAGKKGISIIIAHSREGRKLKDIERMIKRDLILKKVPNGDEICQIQLMRLVDKVVATEINHQIDSYLPSIEEKLAHLDKEQLIKHFVSTEFNRFLSFYKNAPDLNISGSKNNDSNKRGEKNNQKTERTGHAEQGHTRFFINLGKEKDLHAHNLIGLINEYTRNRNIPIGKIDIMRKFSFFEVPSDFATDVLGGLSDANWNGNRVNVEVSQAPGAKSSSGGGNRRDRGDSRDRSKGRDRKPSGDKKRNENKSWNGERSNSSKSITTKRNSEKPSTIRSSETEGSSFKGRFNAAAKRKRRA
ncbi:MAG: hypothetical protein ABR80_05515 [Cryomorphaceae bacterium BACL11 MAG-121015-bin20]|nr:MAG: hypothetical protein ABR80_05515 [Cryomorphaceae bacterium BACL11 MAG-121015-bin20]